MGTDIHVVIEQEYNHRPRVWLPLIPVEFFIWRDYELFSKLAGVRNNQEAPVIPIAEPRGLPENASEWIGEWASQPDYHTVSWISQEEFTDNFPECGTDFELLGRYAIATGGRWDKIRIIFAFDN